MMPHVVTRIFKYDLQPGPNIIDANVVRWLDVGFQGDQLVVWAMVVPPGDGSAPMRCHVYAALTGDEPPRSREGMRSEYIGTAQMGPDTAAWARIVTHVFQVWP